MIWYDCKKSNISYCRIRNSENILRLGICEGKTTKKFFALLLVSVLLVSFAACDSQKLTMRKLVEANQPESLLKTYDSISIHGTMGGEFFADYYLTNTCSYEKHEDWAMYLTDDTGYACRNGVYERLVFLTPDGLADYADYRADQYKYVILSQDSLREKIQSITEAEDQITVASGMDRKNLKKVVGQEGLRSYESSYVMDAKTYALITATGIFAFDDGTIVDFATECAYNTEMPEEINPFLEYASQTEDLRTVTMVFHAGTEKEKAEYIQAPRGLAIGLGLPVNSRESFSVYADAACTVPYQSNGDYTSDITIYIK